MAASDESPSAKLPPLRFGALSRFLYNGGGSFARPKPSARIGTLSYNSLGSVIRLNGNGNNPQFAHADQTLLGRVRRGDFVLEVHVGDELIGMLRITAAQSEDENDEGDENE